ncbi:MAG: ATP-binding protein [Promethearchaeota archaeon]|jgi:CO dehydrogenase maturation factor
MELKKTPLIIAIAGKGGVGKTIVTTLIAKAISKTYDYKLLLIDADPTHPHLSKMVNLIPEKSLEKIRADLIDSTISKKEDIQSLAETLDFKVYDAIEESKEFSLFSIGQPEGPGCFCPSNTLLRKVIESISSDFELVLIDCEAGLEQINRMVISSIDILLIVTDISLRSIETANSIRESAKKFSNYKKLSVIINRVKGEIPSVLDKLEEYKLPIVAMIPEDELITQFDLEGRAIIEIPESSRSFQDIKQKIEKVLEL